MKNQLLFCLCSILNLTICIGQSTPSNKNRSLVFKETATWCGPCGSWGWDLQEQIEIDNKNKALVIALHVRSSYLENPITEAWEQNFTTTDGIPCWYASGIDKTQWALNPGGVSPYGIQKAVTDEVNKFNNATVQANSSFNYTFRNDTLYTSCYSKFFQNLTGEYYLGAYILEDSVLADQKTENGIVQKFHSNILRTSLDNSPFGTQIAKGSIFNGKQFSTNFQAFYIDPKKINFKHSYIATIIWKKENGKYLLINTNNPHEYIKKTSTTGIITANNETKINIFPNPITHDGILELQSPDSYGNVLIRIYDIKGNLVKQQKADIHPELNQIILKTNSLTNGKYLVKVNLDKDIISESFLKFD